MKKSSSHRIYPVQLTTNLVQNDLDRKGKRMIRGDFFATLLAGIILAIGLIGCSSSNPSPSTTPQAGQSTTDRSGHDNHGASGESDMAKMKMGLAKLSPQDAASAEKQHVCPVSGEMLGTMGAPQKIDVSGQMVWICCTGCKEKLLAEPDKFLAKLKRE